MKEYGMKEKILIFLILLIPFIFLKNDDWITELLVFIYAAIFIYIIVDKDVLSLRLPPICEDHPDNKKKIEPSLNPIRKAEQNIHEELGIKQVLNPFTGQIKETKKKKVVRRKK